ncbi:MAG: hypothetical protein PVG39_21225 [Desulfobacteraceae bacterium]|jgi:hypothetical protein
MRKPTKKYNNGPLNKYSIIIFMLTIICSCTGTHNKLQVPSRYNNSSGFSADTCEKIKKLQQELTTLGNNIEITEARQLAETSISYSLYLADEYKLVWPPFFHNILVRIGVKDRGLCYQWTEDLMKRLVSLKLKSFSLHHGVAYRGNDFREHNTVVVTARGQEFTEGIVLDPWRNSGDLYWGAVRADRYPWKER